MTDTQKNLLSVNAEAGVDLTEEIKEMYVTNLIRKRYSLSAELAILRQRDEKPEEFAAYNAFVEDCKARAREIMGGAK